ncbi:MAG: hypothetical protein RR639_04460 [Hydrogenoanaerobacterium sp.]
MYLEMVEINELDFSPYGRYLCTPKAREAEINTGYSRCWGQEYTLPLGEMRFGVEEVDYRHTLSIDKLEQHRESKEVVICGDHPVVIALCLPRDKANRHEQPKIEDIVAVKIYPGDILVLDEYIWHSGCMPLEQATYYFFMYKVRDEELYWVEIAGGPIELKIGGESHGT